MRKSDRYVTIGTARMLKKLGYSKKATAYFIEFKDKKNPLFIHYAYPANWNDTNRNRFVSLPTCDEVIEWLQEKDKDVFIKIDYYIMYLDFRQKFHYEATAVSLENGLITFGTSPVSINMAKRKLLKKLISMLLHV